MEPITDSGNKNSAKGIGRKDTNSNKGAIKQSLKRKEKGTQKHERMSARKKQRKRESAQMWYVLYVVGVATKLLIEQNQTKIPSHNQTRNQK